MDMKQTVQMRIGISGKLVYKDAAGNVIGGTEFRGSAPLQEDQPHPEPQQQEASHGSDDR